MKKVIILICLMLLLTGCVKVENNESDYKKLIDNCLSDKITTNEVALGYKFYIPRGVKLLKNYDYNQTFLIDNTKIYLYTDIISYYYQNKLNYNDNSNDYYYYKDIFFNNKSGYIEITNDNKNYYVKIIYNYSKIEFNGTSDKLPKLISLSATILNSIQYNDIVIERILENNSGDFSNVKYELDKPENASSSFSEYLEEYIQDEDNENSNKILPNE